MAPRNDPRQQQWANGRRGTFMQQPFVNPLMNVPMPPNPFSGSMATPGAMGLFIQQAAEQQARARGLPSPTGPKSPGFMAKAAPYVQQLGQAFANPMAPLQQAFDWANAPQGRDEPRISALIRNGGTSVPNTSIPFSESLVGRAGADLAQFGREMMRTPADQERITQQVFNSMLSAESNGQHVDPRTGRVTTSPKGAIGIAQVMPGTAPEAAKLAGLPWDENRYKNDANYNRAIGYAYFQQKLKEHGNDYAKAVAAYNAGTGGVNKAVATAAKTGGTWQQHVPNETQGYLQKVFGGMGQLAGAFGAPAPGFNAAPYENAMQAQDQAAALLSRPYSATFTEAALPERPTPEAFQAPDYSQGDAAFEATRPTNPFDDPKERRKVQWAGYAKGIGQALASMTGNEGIGTMLMKIGGMALQGRVSGDEKIMEREDQFAQQLQAYNRALAAREDGQAATLANVLNQNIQQRNQQADLIWQDNVKKIQAKNPVVSGDKLITYDRDPTDPNKWTMNVAPLGNAIAAEALLNKSNIGIQMGQAQSASANFAYQSQQAAARTAIGYTTQLALSQGGAEGGQASTEGYAIGAASRARAAVQTGTWRNMFGGDQALISGLEQVAQQSAYAKAGIQLREDGRPVPSTTPEQLKAYQEAFEDSMTATIFEAVAKAGTIDKLYNSPTGNIALTSQRSGSVRQSQRTNAKGTTSTMSWDAE